MRTKVEQYEGIIFYRFTAWIKIVVKHTKIDYIRHLKSQLRELPLDEVIEMCPSSCCSDEWIGLDRAFDFENELLNEAISNLPPKRREVLEMSFILELTPEEIATNLGCTVQHVYNQKSLALKDLSNALKSYGNKCSIKMIN